MRQPAMPIRSPFESSIAKPGQGNVVLSLLPPNNPTLTTLTYKYPLKLVPRASSFVPGSEDLDASETSSSRPVHLYLLTYGGGLLPGDHIEVSMQLEPRTRMVVTTPQGSTKIFKTEPNNANGIKLIKGHREQMPSNQHLADMSKQSLDVRIGRQAALCYLPDPSVPFKNSRYAQVQTFTVDASARGGERSSLCVLDWVTQGRTSRGENWDFRFWRGRNEVWACDKKTGRKRLLLRDSVILDDETDNDATSEESLTVEHGSTGLDSHSAPPVGIQPPPAEHTSLNVIKERTRPHGVVGTLIMAGPVFDSLGSFLMHQFNSQPRIGGQNWSSTAQSSEPDPSLSSKGEVTWTAARVRAGFVLVKFGAKDFETAKDWLGGLLRKEGSIVREFGEEALFCL
ncbi:hypothetical protein N7539_003618 [Penicillium diatomitis]|uniref:Urease accessory protein UreD n=1 Tax=Penicillium diatomitis TaxID=2819901 RepID=A0A9X0BXV6_9EURO|nr:uncharacterized protein N7539_003618 [Penicillium diatomitis]KAJ5488728.1 hypothetical protein N7539_003618 [Penicillium diatomitis]